MPTKPPCPKCGANLEIKALVDSEDRIWQRWHYCPACGDARDMICEAEGENETNDFYARGEHMPGVTR